MFSPLMLKNCLYGINVNEGPLFFASPVIKNDKFDDVTQHSEILDGILYHVCSVAASQEDIVKTRINDGLLERKLKEKFGESISIWPSFLVVYNTETVYRSSCVVKFNNEDDDNTKQCTSDITDFARSSGIPFVSKFVPTVGKLGYTVSVISCESESCEEIDQFEILPVKYIGHHPAASFDLRHSIFKSFEETRSILDLADCHLNKPEIKELKGIANASKISRIKDDYPNPFIVVEGLDGVGKTTLVNNLTERLGTRVLQNPPEEIRKYRDIMVKQCQPVCRAYYSLGNYLIAESIKKSLLTSPVVLDRFWHSTAAYAIALEAKCGDEMNIPAKGNDIYQWPSDLLKPSAVLFLDLCESDRLKRIKTRGEGETNEESQLRNSRLLRQRVTGAYKNMENPECIIVDASGSREEVCEKAITELKNREIWPDTENHQILDKILTTLFLISPFS